LKTKLLELKDSHPSIGDVRVKGLWACLELVENRETKEPLAGFMDSKQNVSAEITKRMYAGGVYCFGKWDYIFIAPPLIITEEQIDFAVKVIGEALEYTDSLVK
jgi:taurine--2-oxoglutarate transaminase